MRKLLVLALAALPLGWGAHGLYANYGAAPHAAPATVAAPARLPIEIAIEGGSNFRDIGGYRTADGHRVRTGLVFRAASTDSLTEADFRLVQQLGIRLFCDLRDAPERHPVRPAGVVVPPVQTWPDEQHGAFDLSNPAAARAMMRAGYATMPDAYAPQIGDIFRHIAEGEVPLLYNCSGGKDRTGLTTALLLSMLGVPKATVFEDYLASNRLFHADRTPRNHPVNAMVSRPSVDPAVMAVLSSVEADWLEASFATIDKKYGGLDGYLHKGLGLSEAEIVAIRSRLLASG